MKKLVDSIRSCGLLALLWRRLTEQCPGPLTESNPKGWAIPDPFQSRLHGIDRLYDAWQAFPINNAIDTIRRYLFGHHDIRHRHRDLAIETDNAEALELLEDHFQRRRYPEAVLLDSYYTAHDFLAGAASVLLLIGRVYYAMVWSDDGKRLARIYRLPEETMKAQFRDGRIWRYKQQYSIFTSNELIQQATPGVIWDLDEEVRGTTFYFAPDEVFFLEWPSCLAGRRGYPPARQAMRYIRRGDSFWDRMVMQAKAMAHSEIEDWRHLRARAYDLDEELRRHKQVEARIRKPFRVVQDVPKTPYYGVWQLKKMLQFVGDIRQFLLDEFNRQVVGAILQRNGLDVEARFVCEHKLTNYEIEELFKRYARGDIDYEEVVEEMLEDKS